MKGILLITIIFLFTPGAAFAGDLKILGPLGLTRAQKKIDITASVVVQMRIPESSKRKIAVILKNVDGIKGEVEGKKDKAGTYRFTGLDEGTWRISVSGGPAEVFSVDIKDQ